MKSTYSMIAVLFSATLCTCYRVHEKDNYVLMVEVYKCNRMSSCMGETNKTLNPKMELDHACSDVTVRTDRLKSCTLQ